MGGVFCVVKRAAGRQFALLPSTRQVSTVEASRRRLLNTEEEALT
jgi:hypothetical protein